WSSEQTSVVRLIDANDVLDKMTYALTNPVKDNLVATSDDWPGATAWPSIMHGKPLTATRPRHFFRADGEMPNVVTLTLARPVEFKDLSREEFVELVRKNVERVEENAARERLLTGERVLGRKGVLAQDWHRCPTSPETK